jgi:hypothetical protein
MRQQRRGGPARTLPRAHASRPPAPRPAPPPPPAPQSDPFCPLRGTALVARLLYEIGGSRSQTWLLPRAALDRLKASLGGDFPPGSPGPTANDVMSALLLGAGAWLTPERVEARGGMNLVVVINARGRFGLGVDRAFFGTNSYPVPVWVPAGMLPAGAAAGGSPLPSPALLAYVHAAVRDMLAQPDGLVRKRYEWMAGASAAGVGARMRACEAASMLGGDVTIDNVSNYPVFDLK